MGRGGRDKATNYPNRSDLRTTQAIKTPTGMGYGEAKKLADAQRAIPLENSQGVQAQAAPTPPAQPGARGSIFRPTDNPNEPVTAGIPLGAGPGPEATPLTATPDDIDVERWRPLLPSLELMANQPSASATSRAFVLRLRSALAQKSES